MRAKSRTMEIAIARIASRQYGNATRQQLIDAGLHASAIGRRKKKGLLIPQFRGVYRVGHTAPSTEAKYMAAVLAAGEGAAISGRAAAHLMRLLKGTPPPPEVVSRTEREIAGVETRQIRDLRRNETWIYQGIPCTTVARTLVDLAAVLPEDALAKAVHEATVRYRTRPEQVEAILARRPRSKGAAKLRRILRGDTRVNLSKLERRFLVLL